jgi:hypothetical protein
MPDETPTPPTNVRVVDMATTLETPVDTMFDHYDDDGTAMFRIVNMPEWFNPRQHTIEVDAVAGNTGLIAPMPDAAMPPGMRHIQELFNEMVDECHYSGLSALLGRAITWLGIAAISATFMFADPTHFEGQVYGIAFAMAGLMVVTHARVLEGFGKLYRRITRGRSRDAR